VKTLTMIRDMNKKVNKSKPWIVAFIILTGIALFTSCEKYTYKIEAGNPAIPVLFETEIQAIFTANCINCHGGVQSPNLKAGEAFSSLEDGDYLEMPAESSELYLTITSGFHISKTSIVEKEKILFWIQQGAKDNK
jgi:hypothetical protein